MDADQTVPQEDFPLLRAIESEDPNQIEDALKDDVSRDTLDFCLTAAVEWGLVEISRLLIMHGADVNHRVDGCEPALKIAVLDGNFDMVKLLLDSGADMATCSGGDGGNALHAAAMCGHVEIVGLLLQRGADPNAKDMDGCTTTYLQQSLFLEKRPEITLQILSLLRSAGATDSITA